MGVLFRNVDLPLVVNRHHDGFFEHIVTRRGLDFFEIVGIAVQSGDCELAVRRRNKTRCLRLIVRPSGDFIVFIGLRVQLFSFLVLVQHKLRIGTSSLVAILQFILEYAKFPGIGLGLTGRSRKLTVFTIGQLALVVVAIAANDRLIIHRRGVGNHDAVICLEGIAESLREYDMEGATVSKFGRLYRVIRHVNRSAVQRNLHAVSSIKGQAFRHLIVEDVVLCAGLRGDGAAEVHGLADVRVVFVTKLVVGILLHLLFVGGCGILFLHRHIRIGRIQRAQRAQRGIDKVITKVKALEFDRRRIRLFYALIRDAVIRSIFLRQFGKGRRISALHPGYIAQLIGCKIHVFNVRAFSKGFPNSIRFVGMRAALRVIAFQVENPINGIGLIHNRVVDRDASLSCGEYIHRQRQQHCKRQQQAGQLFCVPHKLLIPFLK